MAKRPTKKQTVVFNPLAIIPKIIPQASAEPEIKTSFVPTKTQIHVLQAMEAQKAREKEQTKPSMVKAKMQVFDDGINVTATTLSIHYYA